MSDDASKRSAKGKRIRPEKIQERRIWGESGSRCQFCGTAGTSGLQIHHLDEDPENTVAANLIAICGACHERYKHGIITRNDAFRAKYHLTEGKPPFPLLAAERPAIQRKKTEINVGVNNGQVAGKIVNNNYGARRERIVLPGTVAEDADRYNYLEYLMERLAEYRDAGASYRQQRSGKIHVGVIRNMVKNQWDALPKNRLPLSILLAGRRRTVDFRPVRQSGLAHEPAAAVDIASLSSQPARRSSKNSNTRSPSCARRHGEGLPIYPARHRSPLGFFLHSFLIPAD